MKRFTLTIALIFSLIIPVLAQVGIQSNINIDYSNPKEYEVGGVQITGIQYLDPAVIIHLTGLQVGDTILVPGEDISKAIEKLWEQGLFSDIEVEAEQVVNGRIFLNFRLTERPRLSKFSFKGVRKGEADDLRENLKLSQGIQITENVLMNINKGVTDFFVDKGFLNVEVNVVQENDTSLQNAVILYINVNKHKKVKVKELHIVGNENLSAGKLRRTMKETKRKAWWRFYKASKFIDDNFELDKKDVIAKYNEKGYRDAEIIADTVYSVDNRNVVVEMKIKEGPCYYFRNIDWVGNTKYTDEVLSQVFGVKAGDIYNQKILEQQLMGEAGVFSLYQDNGYLFSNITPVETNVVGDSIDLEMQVYEGKQARINRVTIDGNTRTNDHVIMREIRTRPGELYKRSEIQRTIRELAQLGYFDPEKLNVNFEPDREKGVVDLEYIVQEKPSDQIELSGGYGAGRVVGTLGLTFNNFALKKIFDPKAYRPLPTGDGQRLSLKAMASGPYFQSYSFSFMEPWLGGKKPNSLSVSVFHSRQRYGRNKNSQHFYITGAAAGLGRRLKFPDDFFTLYNELSYKNYNIKNWQQFIYKEGTSNNFSFKTILARQSNGPNPIFPTRGSDISVSLELTPPYSLFSKKDYSTMTPAEKYKWIEYHKWKFKGAWYTTLFGSKDGGSRALVLKSKFEFGYLAHYNSDIGPSPFEGFQLGGDGLSGYNLYGSELIRLRGYLNNSLTPKDGGNLYNKFSVELRYPLSLNPTATFYGLVFVEAGNSWYSFKEFNPFELKRSAGVGIRVFMPMIGLLGVDWGYGFDNVAGNERANGSHFHFVIGQEF